MSKIDALVARAGELGMDSVALTDHGALYGAIEFYKKATKAGIKPIIGCEMYISDTSRLSKLPGVDTDKRYHLILLATNELGYRNLVKLVTAAHLKVSLTHDERRFCGHTRDSSPLVCLGSELNRALSGTRKRQKGGTGIPGHHGQGQLLHRDTAAPEDA